MTVYQLPMRVERFVSRDQLATQLGVSVATVDRWKRQGMPHHKWGKRIIRFRASEALAWIDNRRDDAA